jgi:hypothetical protein
MRNLAVLLTLTLCVATQAYAHPHHDDEDVHGKTLYPVLDLVNKGDYLLMISNGYPGHTTGHFPGKGNPHSIQEQSHRFQIPLSPKKSNKRLSLLPIELFSAWQ